MFSWLKKKDLMQKFFEDVALFLQYRKENRYIDNKNKTKAIIKIIYNLLIDVEKLKKQNLGSKQYLDEIYILLIEISQNLKKIKEGNNAMPIIEKGLSALEFKIIEFRKTLPDIELESKFIRLEKASFGGALYNNPDLKDWKEKLQEILIKEWQPTEELLNTSNSYYFFYTAFAGFENIINEKTWPQISKDLISIIKTTDSSNFAALDSMYGIRLIQEHITLDNWSWIVKEFINAKTSEGIKNLIEILSAINPQLINEKNEESVISYFYNKKSKMSYDDFSFLINSLRSIKEGIIKQEDLINISEKILERAKNSGYSDNMYRIRNALIIFNKNLKPGKETEEILSSILSLDDKELSILGTYSFFVWRAPHLIKSKKDLDEIIEILKNAQSHLLISTDITNGILTRLSEPKSIKEFKEQVEFFNSHSFDVLKILYYRIIQNTDLIKSESDVYEIVNVLEEKLKDFDDKEKIFSYFPRLGYTGYKTKKQLVEYLDYFSIWPKDLLEYFSIVARLIKNKEDCLKLIALIRKHRDLFDSPISRIYGGNINTIEEFEPFLISFSNLINDKRYWTVQGLTSLGFLCCHVTNAYFGGAAGNSEVKKDPFLNIINDIKNKYSYNPSMSTIKPGLKNSVALTNKDDIKGSIGIIYDYGYVYQAYTEDTSSVDKGTDIKFRTGRPSGKVEPGIAANLSNSQYNELLIRGWTVSGIFYTKGCEEWAINRLKWICYLMLFNVI